MSKSHVAEVLEREKLLQTKLSYGVGGRSPWFRGHRFADQLRLPGNDDLRL